MNGGVLIPLDRPGRLLKKVRGVMADLEAFLADTPVAVEVLLEALPYADTKLVLKMLPLLGFAGQDRVLWPLYHLIIAATKNEQVSRAAAVQLGLAASLSDDPSAVRAELMANLSHPVSSVRSSCALALGWEGNWPAVKSLMASLQDPDREVQAAVVAALSSMGDIQVFDLLRARLENGTVEEQSSILLNLWRFAEQAPCVEDVYIGCIASLPPELRIDALSGLAMVPLSAIVLDGYRRLLDDEDPRIRINVLENLSANDPADYNPLHDRLILLLADRDAKVRQAAIRLFAMR